MMSKEFVLIDVATLRHQARQHMGRGAVMTGYLADRDEVLRRLNDALATEIVCVLRYRRHYFMARGIHPEFVADEFLAHSREEQAHADLLAQRIVQLGGVPDFSPDHLCHRSPSEHIDGSSLLDMIKEDLIAERIVVDSYHQFIQYLGDKDPTTSRLLKTILATEGEHADELSDLLNGLPERF